MSADLHIHVVEPVELEKDVIESFKEDFSRNGLPVQSFVEYDGKLVPEKDLLKDTSLNPDEMMDKVTRSVDVILDFNQEAVESTPNIWVGSVSWLKAGLFKDKETFIPGPVQAVQDLIGEKLPTITDEFLNELDKALRVENKTTYEVANPIIVKSFLEKYKGKKVFVISW